MKALTWAPSISPGDGRIALPLRSNIAPLRGAPVGWRVRLRWTITVLRFLALALIVFALARPLVPKRLGGQLIGRQVRVEIPIPRPELRRPDPHDRRSITKLCERHVLASSSLAVCTM